MAASNDKKRKSERDSLLPERRGGGATLLLLGAGAALLGIAGIVYLNRGGDEPKPDEAPQADEKVYVAPKPLVVASLHPSALKRPDAGVAEVEAPAKEKAKNAASNAPAEKLGTVDAKAVNAFIAERFGAVRACYERRLKMNPLLQGDLDLGISIASSGRVTGISVASDSVRDREMLDCVRKTIRGWTFPKPEGGRAVIAKNFKFRPKS